MRLLVPAAAVLVLFVPRAEAGAMFTWGARVSTPQLLSASAGFLIGPLDAPPRPPDAPPPERMFIPHGLLLQAEPGVGGGKLALGYAKGLPNLAAGGVKAFYMRTWGQPLIGKKGRDYAGVEADATFFLKLSVGVMRSIDDGPRDTTFTGGLGIGF